MLQETLCSETGALMSNFLGCAQCQSQNRALDSLKQVGKCTIEEKDDDGTKEIVKFTRKYDLKLMENPVDLLL